MNLLLTILCFVVIFIFYLNLVEECKTGRDAELYETDYAGRDRLAETCRSRQPLQFSMQGVLADSHYLNTLTLDDLVEKYGKEEVNVAEGRACPPEYVPLRLEKAIQLVETGEPFVSENNTAFIEETPLHNYFASLSPYLRPTSVLQEIHDIGFGSPRAATALRYHTHHSSFLYVCRGAVVVRMAPYRCGLPEGGHGDGDTVWCGGGTPVDPWTDKAVPWVEARIPAGHVLYMPPRWWHSIRVADTATWYATLHYNTWMNRTVQVPARWLRWGAGKMWGGGILAVEEEVEPTA